MLVCEGKREWSYSANRLKSLKRAEQPLNLETGR